MGRIRGMHVVVGLALAGILLDGVVVTAFAHNPDEAGWVLGSPTPYGPPPDGDHPPANGCSPQAGDPIHLYRGDFEYVRDDISIPGKGMPLEITLRYRSQREYNNRYGYNWFMCYNVRLVFFADNSIEVLWGCGGRDNYAYDAQNDKYTPSVGAFAVLVKTGTDYTLTQPDGVVYNFDSNGRLTSIVDRNSNAITFTYNTTGPLPIVGKSRYVTGTPVAATLAYDWKLTTITDTKGDDIALQYDANGRLETITDYIGREWVYNYNNDDDLEFIATPAITGFPAGLVTELGYDTSHHLKTVEDPEGQTRVTNAYYSGGRLATQAFGTGTMTLTYDDQARTTTAVDGKGFTTKWVFNTDELPTSKKEYTAGLQSYYETTYSYTGNNQIASIVYPRGNSIEYKYDDDRGILKKQRRLNIAGDDSLVTSATYHPTYNLVETFVDARGDTTHFVYDSNGNLEEIAYPAVDSVSSTVVMSYTSAGQMEYVVDANEDSLKYEYYPTTGYVHKIRLDPGGINATYELAYDSVGNVASITDARNKTTTFSHNAMNWLEVVTNALGYQTKYTYDGNGNVKKVERQANTAGTQWQTTQYTYTPTNLLKTITNPLGKVTTYNYDDNNNLSSIVDADTNTTSYTYDERNLLWKVTDALGKITEYGYDDNRNLATITDANLHVTTYGVDQFDRLVRLTYDDGSYERVSLDKNGNVDSLFVNTSLRALYTWDPLGRLATIEYAGGDAVTYRYNAGSQLVQALGPVDTLSYMYDALGRVDSVITRVHGRDYGVGYAYDQNSNRTKLIYPSGYVINTTYTDLNLVKEIQHPSDPLVDSVCVSYDYDTLGRRVYREIPAQLRYIQSYYEYDDADRLTRLWNLTYRPAVGEDPPEPSWGLLRGLWHKFENWLNREAWAGTGLTISDFVYTYDSVGNRLTMSVDGGTTVYGYDDIYQLTSVSGAQSHSYEYDDVGNRETADGISYTSNNLNQYTEVNSVDFDYDPSGNLTDDGVNTYTYDHENRLESVTTGSATVEYTYDPFGRRQMMSVDGSETYFIYDGDNLLAEYDTLGTMKREYVYGAWLDEVVSLKRVSPASRYFYYQDGLGSVSEIMDFNGVLFEQYEYDPYGKTTVKTKTGTTLPNGSAIGNRFAFTGRRLDYETKRYDYRARVYSPDIGRLLQRDPLWYVDGVNLYTYAVNSPANYVDPYGTESMGVVLWFYSAGYNQYVTLRKIYDSRRSEFGDIQKAVRENINKETLPESWVERGWEDRLQHLETARRICAEYGPEEAAIASVGWEADFFWNELQRAMRGEPFRFQFRDTMSDLYYDSWGIVAGIAGVGGVTVVEPTAQR